MLLSQPWRVGLTTLGIGLNAYTVLVHTTVGFKSVVPMLQSHKTKIYDIIGICFQHLMVLPTVAMILQLKWFHHGIDGPYEKPLFYTYLLGNLAFGAWYGSMGVINPLLSTVVAPLASLLCVL
ncbi:uncharacterized protein MCYG_02266 [Microsporum canis CBS 113480]|uniref:Uncharacterized protein n=1 Tax=Arthroderma otae (strain ATCC MYA-4605 / CBS 113480) TaxID=554155 RepID=C5FFK0_ARTOC|nr:uncharacterized protein MCYG_02266 [Microsporum canis CBS 113480]EEQ29447.1 hypothetical protein MCYG_02266 [Microsporum canis CBS 113480]